MDGIQMVLESVMTACSSLPPDWGQFISIMALSRFAKTQLLNEAKADLLNTNQSYAHDWVQHGLSSVPPKLAALSELNRLLAHQPWNVSPALFIKLEKLHSWNSNPELLQAVLILCFYHSLSSIVVKKELSFDNLYQGFSSYNNSLELSEDSEEMIRRASDPTRGESIRSRHKSFSVNPPNQSYNELLAYFKHIRSRNIASLCLEGGNSRDETSQTPSVYKEATKFLCDNLETQYVDFKPRKSDRLKEVHKNQLGCLFGASRYEYANDDRVRKNQSYNTFRDFTWETDGFSLVSALLPNTTDAPHSIASTLDDFLMSRDSSPRDIGFGYELSSHIWSYVHILYGIQFDDFNYTEVNKVLSMSLKIFIKLAACYPDRVTDALVQSTLALYTPLERLHINSIIVRARLHVGLMYALRAFRSYINLASLSPS